MSGKPRRATAAEWEFERAQGHIDRAMSAIARRQGMDAVNGHLARAKACLARVQNAVGQLPAVTDLMQRLDALSSSAIAAKLVLGEDQRSKP